MQRWMLLCLFFGGNEMCGQAGGRLETKEIKWKRKEEKNRRTFKNDTCQHEY